MKTFRALLLVLLVLGLCSWDRASAAGVIQIDALATTTTDLNLRAGPGTTAAIRRSIPAGASIVVRDGPMNDVWYSVEFAGVAGFVHGDYLTQRANPARLSLVATTKSVNLRVEPSQSSGVLSVLPPGTNVAISKKPVSGGWRKVSYGDLTGYVLSDSFTRTLGNGGAKRIIVDLSDQWMYVYEGGEEVLRAPVSTGRDDFDTPVGPHRVQWKAALRTMKGTSNGETWSVPDVPHAMYLTSTGVALHGTYWHTRFGSGVRLSHGCVNLPLEIAALVYDWTTIGTTVVVQA